MKTKAKISGYIVRHMAVVALAVSAVVTLSSAFDLPNGSLTSVMPARASAKAVGALNQARTLTFAERVAYQRAIEDVYWRHRIWPKERPDPKPSLDAVMSQAQLQKKVEEYLSDSQALEDVWQHPITAEQLQAEMERMAQHTKQPEVLHELFEALGNDPFVIAECLARPVLVERLAADSVGEQVTQTSRSYQQVVGAPGNYTLPAISDGASECADDTWTATNHPPVGRSNHTAVWTGSEMIVWGGADNTSIFNTGGRYNPSTDSWATTSTINAPSARAFHTAVWTGSEMIVWGGAPYNTGGRYNPSTNTWIATTTNNAPSARSYHTAVWTGTEMIVWGGYDNSGYSNTGGRYNPSTDTWRATSTTNAPSGRYYHTAVWTGSEMIVWSGNNSFGYTNSGGRYNPGTNSWTATSTTNTSSARRLHTAVWTGSEMIVWGGDDSSGYTNSGGRYNPGTNSWTATSTTNAPSVRDSHTAVWTGSEMIVWGGVSGFDVNTGGRYDPGTDSWTATSITNAPSARDSHTAVWTGTEMIIWGGSGSDTGGRYNPSTDAWAITNDGPPGRTFHTAVWTGSEMIVWGGFDGSDYLNTGDRYNPSTDSWTATTTANAPTARYKHTAVWTGSEMIVWGGVSGTDLTTGGRYNPASDSWIATNTSNAPSARESQTAVLTGSEMIVWGGSYFDGSNRFYLDTGGKYNPGMDSWTATRTTNAASGRTHHTAVWTGSEMIVWGGNDGNNYLNTGGRYNPSMDSWTATSTSNAASGRDSHTAVWTGNEMIIWGGHNLSGQLNTGGRYNPGTNSWTATTTNNAPSARFDHTAVWTGNEMIVWGGNGGDGFPTNTGARYNPSMDIWRTTSTINAPFARVGHTSVWTGSEMIVWGGDNVGEVFNTNGRYCAQLSDTGPPVVTTNPATNIASFSATLNGSLNPNGLTTTVQFEYGPTTSYGRVTPVQTQNGNTVQNISANIGGLSPTTTYHFRIVATNGYGTRRGGDRIFTTLSRTGPPLVTTNPAANIASFSATLNGSVNPHGLTTTVYFQYGPTTSYGSTTPVQTQTGNTFRNVSANISGLSANSTYHFRIVAINSAGTRYGSDSTFTTLSATGPPVVTTNLATFIASLSARLTGSLDPHGLTTTVYFQYGTTTSYGLTTPVQSRTGNTYQNIAANINGLTANTTYHFRIAATNSAVTGYGSDRTFTTLSATGPPVVFTNPATNVTSTSATLNGSLDPHGLVTNVYFQYGTSTSYGHTTATQTQTGNTYRNVTANINGLEHATYHFRIIASNSAGLRVGADSSFTTP